MEMDQKKIDELKARIDEARVKLEVAEKKTLEEAHVDLKNIKDDFQAAVNELDKTLKSEETMSKVDKAMAFVNKYVYDFNMVLLMVCLVGSFFVFSGTELLLAVGLDCILAVLNTQSETVEKIAEKVGVYKE